MVKKECIKNHTFDETSIGDGASLSRTLTRRDFALFAAMSGDVKPAHVDEEFARNDMFHRIIAHGMWSGALISTSSNLVNSSSTPQTSLSPTPASVSVCLLFNP